jgi:hypothetical protein
LHAGAQYAQHIEFVAANAAVEQLLQPCPGVEPPAVRDFYERDGERPRVLPDFENHSRVCLTHEPVRGVEGGSKLGQFRCSLDFVRIDQLFRCGAKKRPKRRTVGGVDRLTQGGHGFLRCGENLFRFGG